MQQVCMYICMQSTHKQHLIKSSRIVLVLFCTNTYTVLTYYMLHTLYKLCMYVVVPLGSVKTFEIVFISAYVCIINLKGFATEAIPYSAIY